MSLKRLGLLSGYVGVALTGLTGCSALDVSNPTRITVDNVTNSVGANYTIRAVRTQVAFAVVRAVMKTGLLTDELFLDSDELPGALNDEAAHDRREGVELEERILKPSPDNVVNVYPSWQTAWKYSAIALPLIQQTATSDEQRGKLSELFALRGFIMVGLAEHICPGFPIRDVDASNLDALRPLFTSAPQTTDSAFVRAIANFDSSLAYAGDSVYLRDLGLVGKARALLGLGRFTEAATVAATVTPGYVGTVVAPNTTIRRGFQNSETAIGVSNREGGTGLNFVSAHDPRLVLDSVGDTRFGDSVPLWAPPYYYQASNPNVVVASDVEAQLIQAEAQLQPADNPSGPWLATLNALRATVALPDTTDPGTAEGRVNLLFRERAFWLFGTAHRLGDLRRLIARYGRDADEVFPTGEYRTGGNYSTATSIPFDGSYEHAFNPAITGCTSR